jgi:hypothetical protein
LIACVLMRKAQQAMLVKQAGMVISFAQGSPAPWFLGRLIACSRPARSRRRTVTRWPATSGQRR